MKAISRKIGIGLGGLFLLLVVTALTVYLVTNPQKPPSDSASAAWLQPGPYKVGTVDLEFVDNNRATMANSSFPGAPVRTFPTTVWFPEGVSGKHPFILHSHGFVSSRTDTSYIAELLASHGYVIAAADYPLTNGGAPGGPNADDTVNQPVDVAFLIDSMLGLSESSKPFSGEIDHDRIGLMGFSLGGLTTSLATFHPRMRDARVKAALTIAGPSAIFTDRFYQTTDAPFLMIAGTADALVDYQSNAAIIPQRAGPQSLLTIEGGAHLGFTTMADPLFRLMDTADGLGCAAIMSGLNGKSPNDVFTKLGSVAEGVYVDPATPDVCAFLPPRKAIHPGRQQMITQLGALGFFESVFADEQSRRDQARQLLHLHISEDFVEASFAR